MNAQSSDSAIVLRRDGLLTLSHLTADSAARTFAPRFLEHVSATDVVTTFQQLVAQYGAVTAVRETARISPYSIEFEMAMAKGYTIPGRFSLEPAASNRYETLWLGTPVQAAGSWPQLVSAASNLPGRASLYVAEIGGDSLRVIAAHEADSIMPIASAAKLYVLGAVLAAIRNGTLTWDSVFILQSQSLSLPTGLLQDWPVGSPLTLHTLVSLMLVMSDNTASDLLVTIVGRDAVERAVGQLGNSHPLLLVPFPTTREVVVLRVSADADSFVTAGEKGRRRLLAAHAADPLPAPSELLGRSVLNGPEWYASASDLGRAWLALQKMTAADAFARSTIALGAAGMRTEQGQYRALKHGSDVGVEARTSLVTKSTGKSYVVVLLWASTSTDSAKLDSIFTTAVALLPN